MSSRVRSTQLAAAISATALLFASGCGSDDSSGSDTAAAPSTPAASSPSAASSTPTGGSDTTAGATTPPGEFALGQQVTLLQTQYDKTGTKPTDTLIGVTITKVEAGKPSDLKNFDLDAQSKQGIPFYVHATFENQSDVTFNGQGMAGALTVTNSAGEDAQKLSLIGDFPKCEGAPPEQFKPGKSAQTCDVYLLPKGQTVGKVRHGDKYAADYIWKVG